MPEYRSTETRFSSFDGAAVKDKPDTKNITLACMNVWFGLDCRGILKFGEYETGQTRSARFHNLTEELLDRQPDVIAIQEANPLPGYAKNLASALNYEAVWKVTNSGVKIAGYGIPTNFNAGNAVLAPKGHDLRYLGSRRLSGRGLQTKHLSIHFRELRDVIAARVKIRGKSLIVFNTQTHFSVIWNKTWQKSLTAMIEEYDISQRAKNNLFASIRKSNERRQKEIKRLIDFVMKITQKYNFPYVIMGDFNATVDSPEMKPLLSELALMDSYAVKNPGQPGYTWDPEKNSNTGYDASSFWANGITARDPLNRLKAQFDRNMQRRIDFIFLSYQFDPDMIRNVDLIYTRPTDGLFASDHFGLRVVLRQLP